MNNQFDELAKSLAQSVTRRAALKRFGMGLGALALAALGLTNKAEAARGDNKILPGFGEPCTKKGACQTGLRCFYGICTTPCSRIGTCTNGFVCVHDKLLGMICLPP